MRYFKVISILQPNQVFVFTSNGSGFHGAGSAAFAMFGRSDNCWREMGLGKMPDGTPGLYAIKGCARGFQKGTSGKSYAIQTVIRPGAKRSISKEELIKQIKDLYVYTKFHPDWDFLIAGSPLNKAGLSGYSGQEMKDLYLSLSVPENVLFPESWNSESK